MDELINLSCLNCGGDVVLSEDRKEATCKYCNRKYRIASTLKDNDLISFSFATEYLKVFRFADAKRKFSEVAKANPNFSEAWWGAFIAEFGIEFCHNRLGEDVPTCHRAHTIKVYDDPNYKKAIATADKTNREEYESLGKKIEYIRSEIIDKANNGDKYDIFICFKAKEINSKKDTEDFYLGRELYHELKEQKYRVFFSSETLAHIQEQEFEPYIYRALSSARVMIVLCSSNDKLESPWVKNEWSRFLDMHNNKGLIPVCGNNYEKFSPYDLPEELRKLNAIEYDGKLFEKLKTKIETFFPERVKNKNKETEYNDKFEKERNNQVEILKKQQEQIDKLINKANETKKKDDEILEIYNEAKNAMLVAESESDYKKAAKIFSNIARYKDSNRLRIECLEKANKAKKDKIIFDAKVLMKRNKICSYKKAIKILESIGEYENAKELISKCKTEIRNITGDFKKVLLITSIVLVAIFVLIIVGTSIASMVSRKGLKFKLNDDGETYTVTGINLFYRNTENLVIPSTYKGKPVVAIKSEAFAEKAEMESKFYRWFHNRKRKISITIPKSIISIGDRALADCTGLEKINYYGSKDDWENISKGFDWDYNSSNYIINYAE